MRPAGPPEFIIVTKQSAAKSQLETAILLWFNEGDPVSIHTLAVAAHDCFDELVKPKGKTSDVREWLGRKSKTFQKKTRVAQNFFKHGANNPKRKLRHVC